MIFRKVLKMRKRNKKQVERKLRKLKLNIFVVKTVQINGLKHIEKGTNLKQIPVFCELFAEIFKSKSDIRAHMRTHTDKEHNSVFNCVECDFIGKNEWTMQIHFGEHS